MRTLATIRHPAARRATAVHTAVLTLGALNALSAAAGAVGLVTGAIDLREATTRLPFDSPLFAGIALFLVVALPQAVLTVAAARHDPRTPTVGMACGVVLVGWILVEVAFLQDVVALHWIYLAVGVVQVTLGWWQRHRIRLDLAHASP